MKILIAPDKFKGISSSTEIAATLRELIHKQDPSSEVLICPMADGGDGTLECLINNTSGKTVQTPVHDPLMRPRGSVYGLTEFSGQKAAIIEMAQASGLSLLAVPERDPMRTTSFGTGELLLEASKCGITNVYVTLGGSATVDGGSGFLQALGAKITADHELPMGASGKHLVQVKRIDLAPAHETLKNISLTGLTDVRVPLLGPQGAARLFAPQKGATPQMVDELEKGLAHWESILSKSSSVSLRDQAGTGAAGGLGLAILALGGKLQGGFDFIADAVDLRGKMKGCNLVITGEGRLDASSLQGKTPTSVARMAKSLGIPCVTIVGASDPSLPWLSEVGITKVYPLFDQPIAPDDPRRTQIAERLEQAVKSLLKDKLASS